jgi:8-oxo-dGTP pyrophosphatase MutT (NUDIX family)
MPHDYAAGGVVYRLIEGAPRILLIRDRYGRWTLPKGHLDPGETNEQAALREIAEETGVRGQIVRHVADITYQVSKKGLRRNKTVAFFLVAALSQELSLPDDDEIQAAEWLAPDEALARIDYAQVRAVLAQALPLISARA